MQQLKKILCATDLLKESIPLIAIGVDLCLRFDAFFLVFHTVPPPRDSVTRQIEFERGGEKKEKIEKARNKIKESRARFDVKWDLVISYGDPVLEVAKIVKQTKTDIVIAASHGLSGFQQFLLGSVIGSMAQTISQPLLVIPPRQALPDTPHPKLELTNIVIACGLTGSDSYLKEYAKIFSEKFNSKICLVHVMESPVNEKVMMSTSGHYDDTQRLLEENLSLKLKNLIPGKTRILHGVPGEELALYAKSHGIDLIIAGIEDHPGRITTTAALLRHLSCAVLTVPLKF